ncbi:MAG: DUF5716 family protein [Lachnospiraceae bacterium]
MVCLYLKTEMYICRKLDVDQTTRPALVSCREGKRVTLSVDERQKDLDFCDLIQESLGTDIYSTIYLVGNGFSQEWAKKICGAALQGTEKGLFWQQSLCKRCLPGSP